MEWELYKESYEKEAQNHNLSDETIKSNLKYAYNLYKQNVPIIYDQLHFSLLVGISYEYILKVTNAPKQSYRRFSIAKKNGDKRIIHEPLPTLKIIQEWILHEILNNIDVSPYAKAYRKKVSLKDNVKFHRNQKKVLRLDIKDFFGSIKQNQVLSIFLKIGYTIDVSTLLAKICTLSGKLPQGSPTSAALSNLVMRGFDKEISLYCNEKKIRYTRYADDMTFSGDFKEQKLIKKVKSYLSWIRLELNLDKTNLMRKHNRQLVTGITVNEKIQVNVQKRRKLRQEVYFIRKYGLCSHLRHRGFAEYDSEMYIKSLIGKIGYCLFINPKDEEFREYLKFLKSELSK
ncbi:reverse transcriptase [Bacillus cereus]|nr:reverse transcriptase [Bacillus cereus]